MDGTTSLESALDERLSIINCTPADIQRFLAAHPPEGRLSPGAQALIGALQVGGAPGQPSRPASF